MSPRVIKALRDVVDALEAQADPDQVRPIDQGSELLDARASGLGVKLFRKLVTSGELQGSRVGRRYVVRRSELDRWLSAQAVKPNAKALPVKSAGKTRTDHLDAVLDAGLARGKLRSIRGGQ